MIQIERILCPVDFSEHSEHALDHAIAVAHLQGACVTVLNVFPLAIPADPFAGLPGFQPFTLQEPERERLLAQLREFASREAGGRIHCMIREGTNIHAEILAAADDIAPDLIVMGTHGRSGFERLTLGSVAEKILRKANCPVLTVPPRAPDAVPAGPLLYTRVLCGVDFSDCSLVALEYARALVSGSGGSLDVVTVVQQVPSWQSSPVGAVYPELATQIEADAKQRVGDLVAGLPAKGFDVEGIVRVGTPYREIVRLAVERNADLIVLGVHGHGVVDRMLFGSTTNHVVRQAACPVLTIKTESPDSKPRSS